VTLIAELQDLIHQPLHAYVRYDNWRPDAHVVIDSNDDTLSYAVSHINRLSIGLNYVMNDYLQIKFEYPDALNSNSEEPDFEGQLGTAQLVVAF